MVPVGPTLGNSIRFGEDYELDLRAYELRRSGQPLKLERIPMELLLLLLEHQGQLVTRGQIIERIWGKDVFVDTDNSINAAIRKVRQVLEDDREQPRFVQTVTAKGYRFIAPIHTGDDPTQAASDGSGTQDSANLEAPAPQRTSKLKRWPLFLGLAVVLAVCLTAYFGWHRAQARHDAPGGRLMLAVMPFENLTGDPSQDYFSDGLTEEMISQLGNLDPQHLGVTARTSVMYYKGRPEPLEQIARELGVQYVLEGSVRRDSGKVRITAQLIQMKDQSHLWAREYDRELSSLLDVQSEISRQVADEIQLALGNSGASGPVQPTPPKVYEAYDLYLRGRYFWNKRSAQDLQQALEYFQQAIDKDPSYARAYAGLADSYALLSGYRSGVVPQVIMPKARAAAVRAIELDERSAEAHTALAVVAQNYDWDWPTAEKEYRRAIQLDPNYATAHHWYGEYLGMQGRFEEAFRELEHARQLDPLSLIIASDTAVALYYSRDYDRSIEKFRAVQAMEPNYPRAGFVIAPYSEKGMFQEALASTKTWEIQPPDDKSWLWSWQANLYGRSGDQVHARRALKELLRVGQRRHIDAVAVVMAYIGVGDKQQALSWLEKAYAERSTNLVSIKVSPIFDPLRSEPRFQEVMRRMGLAK